MVYEWDPRKAKSNIEKHGISFEEAATVFLDPLAATFSDPDHSSAEPREITIGHTGRQQVIFVSHCQRGKRIRIISARKASRKERTQYEEELDQAE